MSDTVQVWFRLSGGPATALGTAAERLAPDRVRLLYSPWAQLDAARGDIYRVEQGEDGQLWVRQKLQPSGYCAVRVTLADDSPLGRPTAGVEAILDKFAVLGVTGAGMFGLAVLDIPPHADMRGVRQLLHHGQRDRWWDYEELCVTAAWRATAP